MKTEKRRIRALSLVLQHASRIKTTCLKSNVDTSWPWFVIGSQATTYRGSYDTLLSKQPHIYPTTCLFFLIMANVPPGMNKNMAPNPTGTTLCLFSPSVTSVETGTETNSGPMPTVNQSWGYELATIPKMMDSCFTSQPQKSSGISRLQPGTNYTIRSRLRLLILWRDWFQLI